MSHLGTCRSPAIALTVNRAGISPQRYPCTRTPLTTTSAPRPVAHMGQQAVTWRFRASSMLLAGWRSKARCPFMPATVEPSCDKEAPRPELVEAW